MGRPRRHRIAKNLGVARRADVQAIVDAANAETAPLRNLVIGTQSADILRDPAAAQRVGDGQPRRRRHARASSTEPDLGVEAALTNSGGLRADLRITPPSAGGAAGRDHVGRGVRRPAVRQPHGHRDPDRSAAPRGVAQRLQPGVQPGVPWRHRALPAGRRAQADVPLHRAPPRSSTSWRKAPDGPAGPLTPSGRRTPSASSPTTSCSPAVTATPPSPAARTCCSGAICLLDAFIEHIAANSPVAPVVEGRIVRS